MDDFLILGYDKKELWAIKNLIQRFLREQLKLELNPKQLAVSPASRGINFLGYTAFPYYRLLRPSTVKRYLKRIKVKIKKFGPAHPLSQSESILSGNPKNDFVLKHHVQGAALAGGSEFLSSPEFQRSWASWASYAQFAKTWHLRKKMLKLFQDQSLAVVKRTT